VEGTVTRWLKRAGERVARGEGLVEIETDKVNSELESPSDGVLAEILVAEGTTVPVGAVLARIEGAEVAASHGGGAAVVAASLPSPPAAPGLPAMRRRIAERMQEARATIVQGACIREVDLSGLQRRGSWTAYFVKALALAGPFSNIGVAVEVPEGLLVPVVRGADRRDVAELTYVIGDLAERAREQRLAPADVVGGEFTVTNVGGTGATLAFPLVNPGQPGILAPGAVVKGRCLVTLCYDRAAMDEAAADGLLGRVAAELAGIS
jgi:pyruvate/2-oxoglutarate dehydrogenase complex dihydrolipoamide acyltransferase (E2) component